VAGTEFDFQTERSLGDFALDTPFLLQPDSDFAARLTSMVSGIRLTIRTDQPGVVIYTPGGFAGICLETQNLPDAPRFAHFPDSRLDPGETYVNESQFCFESIS
jgi:aldose 1-epimerase